MADSVDCVLLGLKPGGNEVTITHPLTVVNTEGRREGGKEGGRERGREREGLNLFIKHTQITNQTIVASSPMVMKRKRGFQVF